MNKMEFSETPPYLTIGIIALLLTIASIQVQRFGSDGPEAGLPFVYIENQFGGGSPTSTWYTIGPEDYFPPRFFPFLGNALVYSALLLLVWWGTRSIYYRQLHPQLKIGFPLAGVALAVLIIAAVTYYP